MDIANARRAVKDAIEALGQHHQPAQGKTTSATNTSATNAAATNASATNASATNRPTTNTSATNTSATNTSATNTSGAQTQPQKTASQGGMHESQATSDGHLQQALQILNNASQQLQSHKGAAHVAQTANHHLHSAIEDVQNALRVGSTGASGK